MATKDLKFIQEQADGSFIERTINLGPGEVLAAAPDGELSKLALGMSLGTNDPITDGVEADLNTEGVAPDGTRWKKVGAGNNEWEQIMVSEGGEFVANIELEDVTGTIPPVGVLGRSGSKLTMGDGLSENGVAVGKPNPTTSFASFNLISDPDTWRKAAKFTSTKATTIEATVTSSTGYAMIVNYDGTYGDTGEATPNATAKVGTGTPASNITVESKTPTSPYNTRIPKFYAIYPCDASGNLDGNLTLLSCDNNQLTSFDGTGLSALTDLQLRNNQLTSFDGTGLGSLTILGLANNQLTSIDATGLSALTYLAIEDNQLTSIDLTGMTSLLGIDVFDNPNLNSITGIDTILTWYKYQASQFCIGMSNCGFVTGAQLNALYSQLPNEVDLVNDNSPYGGPDISVFGNAGAAFDDPTIATTKGWVVSESAP